MEDEDNMRKKWHKQSERRGEDSDIDCLREFQFHKLVNKALILNQGRSQVEEMNSMWCTNKDLTRVSREGTFGILL